MRRRLETCKEVPQNRTMGHVLSLYDSSAIGMRGVPRESELKWIFKSRELSMERKCKYEGVRLYGWYLQFDHYC